MRTLLFVPGMMFGAWRTAFEADSAQFYFVPLIVVVANGQGIDFLLKDAVDRHGTPFLPTLEELRSKGVVFKVCRNTLTSRKLNDDAVTGEAVVIQAAVAEIARLQIREGYAYLKP